MIESMRKYAEDHRVPIINDEGLEFLKEHIIKSKSIKILELGSAIGYSAIQMALIDDNIHITTIEKDEERYHIAVDNIKNMGLEDRIDIYCMDAYDFETEIIFDFIFLDSAKGKYEMMLNKFYPNLKKGGVVFVDNLGMHGLVYKKELNVKRRVRQLVEKIRSFRLVIEEDDRFTTTIYDDIGDGIGILVKGKEGYNE